MNFNEPLIDLLDNHSINEIEESLPILMGYSLDIYYKYKKEFDKLTKRFINLSRLVIKDECDGIYKYFCDFRSFFMYYDIFLESKKVNLHRLIYLLTESFNERIVLNDEEKYKDNIIKDVIEYRKFTSEALHFIREYSILDKKVKDELEIDIEDKIKNSYNACYKNDVYDNNLLKLKFGNYFLNQFNMVVGKK